MAPPPETATAEPFASPLVGSYEESPAGPINEAELATLKEVPMVDLPKYSQIMRFGQRQAEFVLKQKKEHGDVFRFRGIVPGRPVVTSHPSHIKSVFTAKPALAPSLTAESPLRPIVGAGSVLTAQGPRHLRQRKLLLPPFHGEAISGYMSMIEDACDLEIAKWPVGKEIELAPKMQAITLDVIMSGIFGIEGRPQRGTPEWGVRAATKSLTEISTWPVAQAAEFMNVGREEPVGLTKYALQMLDKPTYAVIEKRRKAADLEDRHDILSILLQARTEEGEPLTDSELRDELLSLVLAGHETTANSLAWAWERLTRSPDAYSELFDAVRNDREDKAEQIEYVINETMRSRPVIPIIGRRTTVPWRLGEYGVSAGTPISMSILLVHHREDLYPEPWEFKPERWVGNKPGTYEWIPFGGGTRRCLGAALALAEMRVVLEKMVQQLDIVADRPEAEHVQHRNVTMIPARGARVVITKKH